MKSKLLYESCREESLCSGASFALLCTPGSWPLSPAGTKKSQKTILKELILLNIKNTNCTSEFVMYLSWSNEHFTKWNFLGLMNETEMNMGLRQINLGLSYVNLQSIYFNNEPCIPISPKVFVCRVRVREVCCSSCWSGRSWGPWWQTTRDLQMKNSPLQPEQLIIIKQLMWKSKLTTNYN